MKIEEIVKITVFSDLFPPNEDIKAIYRDLIKQYHPDICKHQLAQKAFIKINELYSVALKMGAAPMKLPLMRQDGISLKMEYYYTDTHQLGRRYISDDKIIYIIDPDKAKYVKNAITMTNFSYKSNGMKDLMKDILPKNLTSFELADKYILMQTDKPKNIHRLSTTWDYHDKKVPHRHVAWIVSRLLNFLCYFETMGFAHNGLGFDSCYVDHKTHQIFLLDNWFYTRPIGEKLIGVPIANYNLMPLALKLKKISGIETDIETVKHIAKRLLGQEFDSAPQPIKDWINAGALNSAVAEFERWGKAINLAYGGRKWISLEMNEFTINQIERGL